VLSAERYQRVAGVLSPGIGSLLDVGCRDVAALDVLEHTDNIWFVFGELVRLARRQLIVILPNLYHWTLRLQYLRGKEMDKYALPHQPIVDRHRWLTSYERASAFCRSMAARHGLTLSEQVVFNVRRTRPVDAALSLLSKNLGAWAVMYAFEPRPTVGGRDR
jgi:hypothetical protein